MTIFNNKKCFDFRLENLDKISIKELLNIPSVELFSIQDLVLEKYRKSKVNKDWLDGIINLKYKKYIDKFYQEAIEYFKDNNNKYKQSTVYNLIEDKNNIIKIEFYKSITDFGNNTIKVRLSLVEVNKKNNAR